MVNVINNYKNKYLYCPVCGDNTREIDSQQHLLLCAKLHEGTPTEDGSKYLFIFSFNLEKMKEVVTEVQEALLKRASLTS